MWKDEYVRLMFPENIKDMEMESAMKLKYANIPTQLYKYRSVSNYSLENLVKDEIWFSPANSLNDPYDCALTISQNDFIEKRIKLATIRNIPDIIKNHNLEEIPNDKLTELEKGDFVDVMKFVISLDKQLEGKNNEISKYAEAIKKTIDEFNDEHLARILERSQGGTFISCFSEVNNSILMWSHYANSHTGFCVEYNFKKEGIDPILTRSLQPVVYSKEMFDLSNYLQEASMNKKNFNNLIITYAAIIKSLEWSYEKEWRIVFPIGSGAGFNRNFFQPGAIYLGTKMIERYKKIIIEIAEKKDIPVYQMEMKNNQFKLIAKRII
ncbi:DUF2971 domain-containing protein [Ornithinibacillus californiensis]|uniref:DUF2971 domain-containing protein n=1 Tax=Ornithinibacillus californiensis TaxID=161536 RepID=UPI00064D864F|nr:DUF2971 domain-containing protein [Ornithinibacillus californiensis]